jgi:putative restriction endonuclease
LVGIRPDKDRAGHYYADVRNFLQFDTAVSFRQGDFFFEAAMKGADGRTNSGSAQRAVRNIPDNEFELILRAGFAQDIGETPPHPAPDAMHYGFEDEPTPFIRPLVETTITRPFRDIAFARQVGAAYDKRCAMTGLKIINGGGRAEAQAAHIHPVAENGPDSVRNGISLSSTFHWMFDRGLISIDDDFKILQAKSGVPPQIQGMINKSGFLNTPDDPRLQPHRHFLRYHRENKFKG